MKKNNDTRPQMEKTGTAIEPNLAICAEEFEEIVLAACFLERDALGETLQVLRSEMFYKEQNSIIFDAVRSLYASGRPVDIITVTEELRRMNRLEEVGGPYRIAEISGRLASTAHLQYHCTVLYEYYIRRSLARLLAPSVAEATDPSFDIFMLIFRLRKDLDALISDSPLENHLHTIREVMGITVETVEHRQEMSVNGLTGVPTGFADLDKLTGGWQSGNLIYTAGRPGDGKTALNLHMARTAARAGYPVVIATLEMTAGEIGERMVLAQCDIDPLRMRQGRLSPEEMEKMRNAAEEIAALPVHVDDTPYVDIDQLCGLIKSLNAKGLCGLVIIDYLQLIGTVSAGRTREQEVAECSRKLKALARSIGTPVIVSSQLNRQAEEQAVMPELRHLRESGAIEQDADLVVMIHRPERYHISVDPSTGASTEGMGILSIAKHRNGSTGRVYYSYNRSMTHIGTFVPVPADPLFTKQKTVRRKYRKPGEIPPATGDSELFGREDN